MFPNLVVGSTVNWFMSQYLPARRPDNAVIGGLASATKTLKGGLQNLEVHIPDMTATNYKVGQHV